MRPRNEQSSLEGLSEMDTTTFLQENRVVTPVSLTKERQCDKSENILCVTRLEKKAVCKIRDSKPGCLCRDFANVLIQRAVV